jgi:2-polyprenyl-6-methoxyphenol hydroxylase-like FAD-dependent oxidoreductase
MEQTGHDVRRRDISGLTLKESRNPIDVLIVGAGPTGLVLALWLTRLGATVRVVDKTAEPSTTSRAVAVQARTLEFYRQIGLADAVIQRGREVAAANLWVAGRQVARLAFGDMGAGISPYPFAFIFPQDEHERVLVDTLKALGVSVDRQTELVAFEERDQRMVARLSHASGLAEECDARFIAGCDGAHSAVRDSLSIGFSGGTYDHLFYVADVEARGDVMNGEVHAALDRSDFLAVFPLKGSNRARLVGTIRDEAVDRGGQNVTWDDVGRRVIEWLRIEIQRVNWFSTYRVHHRVADRFRSGRVFLLGDAAHVHSPVGGQGMNTGIGDAVNLAWKLAAVVRCRARANILDTYEPERIAFARRLVATTDRAFSAVTSSRLTARVLRLHVAPAILPALFALDAVRRVAFRTVSQTAISYRGSALSAGRAGDVSGGDRLPWVRIGSAVGERDNFAPLASLEWQVHVYGHVQPTIRALCSERQLALHNFIWRREMKHAGLHRDGLYLVRPDGYVGLAAGHQSAGLVGDYLDSRQINVSR